MVVVVFIRCRRSVLVFLVTVEKEEQFVVFLKNNFD